MQRYILKIILSNKTAVSSEDSSILNLELAQAFARVSNGDWVSKCILRHYILIFVLEMFKLSLDIVNSALIYVLFMLQQTAETV
jgi:hypothetical protein